MAADQKPKAARESRSTPVLIPQGVLAGQSDVPLDRPVTTVGSNENARLHLVSRTVSKGHAIFVNSNGSTYVADMASRTGVLLNGKLVKDAELKTGDRVQIGKFVFRYRSPAATAPPSPQLEPPAASVIVVGSPAVAVSGRTVIIGRRETSDVPIPGDSGVSAAHAVIFQLDGSWYIRDLGSRTGTVVNGKPIHQQELKFGDRIAVGSSTILFQPGAPAAADPEDSGVLDVTSDFAQDTEQDIQEDVERIPAPAEDEIPMSDPIVAEHLVNWKSAFPPSPVEPAEEDLSAIPLAESPVQDSSVEAPRSQTAETGGAIPFDFDDDFALPLEELPTEVSTADAPLPVEPEPADETYTAEIANPSDAVTAEPDPAPTSAESESEQGADPLLRDQSDSEALPLEEVEAVPTESTPASIPLADASPELIEPDPVEEITNDKSIETLEIDSNLVAVEKAALPSEPIIEDQPLPVDFDPAISGTESTVVPSAVSEPEFVATEDVSASIPETIAAEPVEIDQVPEAVTPSVTAPIVAAPVVDHLLDEVDDFIFVPTDESSEPNAVPDFMFWGDPELDEVTEKVVAESASAAPAPAVDELSTPAEKQDHSDDDRPDPPAPPSAPVDEPVSDSAEPASAIEEHPSASGTEHVPEDLHVPQLDAEPLDSSPELDPFSAELDQPDISHVDDNAPQASPLNVEINSPRVEYTAPVDEATAHSAPVIADAPQWSALGDDESPIDATLLVPTIADAELSAELEPEPAPTVEFEDAEPAEIESSIADSAEFSAAVVMPELSQNDVDPMGDVESEPQAAVLDVSIEPDCARPQRLCRRRSSRADS